MNFVYGYDPCMDFLSTKESVFLIHSIKITFFPLRDLIEDKRRSLRIFCFSKKKIAKENFRNIF